jgi:hypothetical protein
MSLPTDRDARNAIPLWDGLFSYFPDVWAEVAKVSVLGNKQHGLGEKLFWNREVSTDHLNKVFRHCFDHGTGTVMDTDGAFHMAKAVWRACAELQLAIEKQRLNGATIKQHKPDDFPFELNQDNGARPGQYIAVCYKCGRNYLLDKPVEGLYFCGYGCT